MPELIEKSPGRLLLGASGHPGRSLLRGGRGEGVGLQDKIHVEGIAILPDLAEN